MKKGVCKILLISTLLMTIFSCVVDEGPAAIREIGEDNELPEVSSDDEIIIDDTISYSNQVAAILENYCTSCHGGNTSRSGVSLHTYDLAVFYANEIKSTIMADYMPPSVPMLDADKEIIYTWIENDFEE